MKVIEIRIGEWILKMPFDHDSIDTVHGFIDACFDEMNNLKTLEKKEDNEGIKDV